MALNIEPQCPVCQLIQAGDKKLKQRIDGSKKWVKGGESLRNIQRSYTQLGVSAFSEKSIENHANKHQAPSKRQAEVASAKKVVKELEDSQIVADVRVARHFNDDLQELKAIGMEMVRTGDSKVSAAVLAKLIDIEVKIEEKAKDRSLELAKMVAHFASGAGRLAPAPQTPYIAVHPVEAEEGQLVN